MLSYTLHLHVSTVMYVSKLLSPKMTLMQLEILGNYRNSEWSNN